MKTSKNTLCSNLFEWVIYRIQCANAFVQITTQNKYIFKYIYNDKRKCWCVFWKKNQPNRFVFIKHHLRDTSSYFKETVESASMGRKSKAVISRTSNRPSGRHQMQNGEIEPIGRQYSHKMQFKMILFDLMAHWSNTPDLFIMFFVRKCD